MALQPRIASRFAAVSRPWPAAPTAWAVAAVLAGLVLARLPVHYGAALIVGGTLAAASVWQPAVGIALAIGLGLTRAYLAISFPGLPTDLGQIFLALALAGWLARGLARRDLRVARSWLWVPLGAWLLAGGLSLLGAASLEEGGKEVLKWLQVALTIVIILDEARRRGTGWLLAVVLVAGLFQAGVGIWQVVARGGGPSHFLVAGGLFRAYGTFEQPNPFGGYLGLTWPVAAGLALESARLALGTRLRRLRDLRVWAPAMVYGGAAALLALGLFLSFSRGAWLGAAAAGAVLVMRVPRRLWAGLALVAAAALAVVGLAAARLLPASLTARLDVVTEFVSVTDARGANITEANYAILERVAHWQAADAMAREHPVLGVGLGNYAVAYPRYSLMNWPMALGHAHNIYLNLLAETGVVGLSAYLALWAVVFAATIMCGNRLAGAPRGLALGLLGAWTHLTVHHFVDNLYVNNVHLTVAALLALLACLCHSSKPAPATLPQPDR